MEIDARARRLNRFNHAVGAIYLGLARLEGERHRAELVGLARHQRKVTRAYFYLYVVINVFSRYVVGWMVAHRELASLAQRLLGDCYRKQGVKPDELTIHADRGTSMMSKPVALLLADLGVTKTHSRPKTSNDNPFSEAHFKTLKYRPNFPDRFGAIEHARAHCADFFAWYHLEHHHAGLGLLTPHDVHHGLASSRIKLRTSTLAKAFSEHPERFPNGQPIPQPLPTEVWINKPGFLQ